jgi:HPt (histidine-containing phosphotransfer) domain-containing protein
MKDLVAQFLPRFKTSAAENLGRAREFLASGDATGVERELHRLAGDAAILGLTEVAELARRGQEAARELAGSEGATADECAVVIDQLADAVKSA